jgi:hypothetical protein
MNKPNVIFERIKEDYETTMTAIADNLLVKRSTLYSVLKKGEFDKEMEDQLRIIYPESFRSTFPDIDIDETTAKEIEQYNSILEEDNAMLSDSMREEAYEVKKQNKKFNPPFKNCWCLERCYFVKVMAKDYKRIKPICPICQGEMLCKEDRAKAKVGQSELFSTDEFEGL